MFEHLLHYCRGTTRRSLAGLLASCLAASAYADTTMLTLSDATTSSSGTPVTMLFPVARSGDLGFDTVLNYHTVDGTAFAGIDYTAAIGSTIIVPAGATSASIPVTLAAHFGGGPDQTFQVVLDGAVGIGSTPSFSPYVEFPTGALPYSVVAADVNGDGMVDLIVANYGSSNVSVLLNTTSPGATSPSFATQQTFATGLGLYSGPYSVTAVDLNGDGMVDLVTADGRDDTISVLLNTTTPGDLAVSFSAHQTFAVGSAPISVIAADVNGDGKPDLVVANNGDSTVSVLLDTTTPGSAAASFATQQTFATGGGPVSVVTADVNGDGKPDLLVANYSDNNVSVLVNTTAPGAATPSFATAQTFASTSYPPLYITTGDFNGDGKPDLAVTGGNSVLVLLNTTDPGVGTPSFSSQQTFGSGTCPPFNSVWVTDVNGDGKPDLIAAGDCVDPIIVLANTTVAGTSIPSFAAQQSFVTGGLESQVITADVNRDGKPDLIAANPFGSGAATVSVLLNTTANPTATRNFTAAQTQPTGHAHAIKSADFNKDGKLDLVVANAQDNTVSILLNSTSPGAATSAFAAQQTFAVGAGAYALAVGDLNGDGLADVVAGNFSDNNVSVLLNTTSPGAAAPSFSTQATFATGRLPEAVAIADLNGDGVPDLVVPNYLDATVSVLFNTTAPGAAAPTFAAQMTFATGTYPQDVAIADLNGDGKPDLVVSNYNDATVSVLFNTTAPGAATPSFAPQVTFATVTGTHAYALAVADVNGDGLPDIVVTNYSGTGSADSVSVLLNTTAPGAATPSFATQQTFTTGAYPFSVTVADLDGDGRPDILVGNYLDSTVSMLINTTSPGAASPSFAAQQTFGAAYPYSVATADINGDGRPDILVADAFAQTVSVLLNTQYQTATAGRSATGTITHEDIFANGFE